MIIIKIFVAILWAFIGLVIWIPILFRVMFLYIFNIFYLTIVEKDIEVSKQVDLLVNTSAIYQNGFKNIFSENSDDVPNNKDSIPKRKIWSDLLWLILFWGTLIIPLIYKQIGF